MGLSYQSHPDPPLDTSTATLAFPFCPHPSATQYHSQHTELPEAKHFPSRGPAPARKVTPYVKKCHCQSCRLERLNTTLTSGGLFTTGRKNAKRERGLPSGSSGKYGKHRPGPHVDDVDNFDEVVSLARERGTLPGEYANASTGGRGRGQRWGVAAAGGRMGGRRRVPSLSREGAFLDVSTCKTTKKHACPAAATTTAKAVNTTHLNAARTEAEQTAELYRLGLLYDDEHVRGSGFDMDSIVRSDPAFTVNVRPAKRARRQQRQQPRSAAVIRDAPSLFEDIGSVVSGAVGETGFMLGLELGLNLSSADLSADEGIRRWLIDSRATTTVNTATPADPTTVDERTTTYHTIADDSRPQTSYDACYMDPEAAAADKALEEEAALFFDPIPVTEKDEGKAEVNGEADMATGSSIALRKPAVTVIYEVEEEEEEEEGWDILSRQDASATIAAPTTTRATSNGAATATARDKVEEPNSAWVVVPTQGDGS